MAHTRKIPVVNIPSLVQDLRIPPAQHLFSMKYKKIKLVAPRPVAESWAHYVWRTVLRNIHSRDATKGMNRRIQPSQRGISSSRTCEKLCGIWTVTSHASYTSTSLCMYSSSRQRKRGAHTGHSGKKTCRLLDVEILCITQSARSVRLWTECGLDTCQKLQRPKNGW